MKTRNLFAMAFASVVLLANFTGCGKQEEVTEETEPKTLPVEVADVTSIDYYEPENDTGLVPPIPLRLRGVSYEVVTVNTNVFHFNDEGFSGFLKTGNLTVDSKTVKDVENTDFKFHGFALKSGGAVKMYAELTKDGELVEEYSTADEDSYEVKALYTSADLLGWFGEGNYFSCGTRVFVGLPKYDIETMNGKGYTSGFDTNTFYYPDVEGWTLGLSYVDESLMPKTLTADSASDTDAEKKEVKTDEPMETEGGSEVLDENGNPIPKMYLSELYLFRGDALIVEPSE